MSQSLNLHDWRSSKNQIQDWQSRDRVLRLPIHAESRSEVLSRPYVERDSVRAKAPTGLEPKSKRWGQKVVRFEALDI